MKGNWRHRGISGKAGNPSVGCLENVANLKQYIFDIVRLSADAPHLRRRVSWWQVLWKACYLQKAFLLFEESSTYYHRLDVYDFNPCPKVGAIMQLSIVSFNRFLLKAVAWPVVDLIRRVMHCIVSHGERSLDLWTFCGIKCKATLLFTFAVFL